MGKSVFSCINAFVQQENELQTSKLEAEGNFLEPLEIRK